VLYWKALLVHGLDFVH